MSRAAHEDPMKSLAERELRDALVTAVELAARVTTRVQGRQVLASSARTKPDQSPVTVADLASQAVVTRVLSDRFPGIPLVGEEDASMLERDVGLQREVSAALAEVWPEADAAEIIRALERGRGDPPDGAFFTLDPVDGTKGFLRGGHYAVALALIEGGVVQSAALGCPTLAFDHARALDSAEHGPDAGTLVLATRGCGASERRLAGGDEGPLQVRSRGANAGVRLAESVESGHTRQQAAFAVLEGLGGAIEVVRLDSQVKYAVVARGQADVYLRLATRHGYAERIWDHAAGSLIASEAGFRVSDARGAALDFSAGRGLARNTGIVVAHPELASQVLERIRALDLVEPPA